MLQTIKRLVAFLGILVMGLSAAQSASVYNFSYTFGNGKVATGSFTGIAIGNLVTELSGISVTFDGTSFTGNGSLNATSYNNSSGPWIGGGAVASFDGTQNNFLFGDGGYGYPGVPTNQFYAITYRNIVTNNAAVILGDLVPAYDYPDYSASRWSLVAAPVPEPGPVILWGAGLAGLIVLRRRRSV